MAAADKILGERCSSEQASKAVRLILGSYPNRNVVDEDVYVRQLAGLVESYPLSIVRRLCDPARGIAAQSKFLPTLAEVGELAGEWVQEIEQSRQRASGRIEQIEHREPEPTREEKEMMRKAWAKVKQAIAATRPK